MVDLIFLMMKLSYGKLGPLGFKETQLRVWFNVYAAVLDSIVYSFMKQPTNILLILCLVEEFSN